MNHFFVSGTKNEDRKKAKYDYVVCVNSNIKKRLSLGNFAVINNVIEFENQQKQIHAHCRVLVDDLLSDNKIRLDQTLRTAIGIPFEYDDKVVTVEIYPLDLSLSQTLNEYISRLLGRRYLFLRVCKAEVPDMEKNYSRVTLEAIKLLGTTEGNNLILESTIKNENNRYILKKSSNKVYELTLQILTRREELEKKLPDRFPNPKDVLKIDPDTWRIFLDAHVRDELQLNSLDAVKVRRDLLSIFVKEFREFGILFFISLFAIVEFLPIEFKAWKLLVLVSITSLIIALFLTLVNIRARVK